jgi:uncharacterized membrane protein
VRTADERVGLNGSVAAALTRWVGSMWAVYATLAITGAWMALATWGPLHRVDPYPFAFMLFLGNLAQILLCFVIMVGQRVLGAAADRRSLQTYLNAEAIFERVSEVQGHLDRHDRLFSRGISQLESRPHPWIEQHHVQQPPQAKDQAVSVNGRFAAWITQRVGSMWAFYVAAAIQLVWMGLAVAGVQRFDPYPFAFLLFLSSLIQLILMLVIMVGQDVLGRAADRRSEQTFLDAQAILYECERLKTRLTAQDRIIGSLCDYTHSQVTERLARAIHDSYARAIHEAYVEASAERGEPAGGRSGLRGWDELPDDLKESNRAQAMHVGEKLAELGCIMVPTFDPSLTFAYRDEGEVLLLARMEHVRWMRERLERGYVYGPVREGRFHPDLVPWEELSEETREKDVQAVRNIPAMLAAVGFQVLRVTEPAAETA